MHIIPMRELKNTAEIERKCSEANEPIFVTKNGYGSLVVMDIDYYTRVMSKIIESEQINTGLNDLEAGKIVHGNESLKNTRLKHGI